MRNARVLLLFLLLSASYSPHWLQAEEREAAAKAEAQRNARIDALLATAKANDSQANGRVALASLDELLSLEPNHSEGKRLKDKISAYYGPRTFKNTIGMEFIEIKPGEFMMGGPEGEKERQDNEKQHRVRITKGFMLGIYEVTQSQWREVMNDNPSRFKGDDLPVEKVSWDDATEFCRKLSQKEGKRYRLPSEAEWEYACRAGTKTPFNTGESISTSQANYNGDYTYGSGQQGEFRKSTIPVGSFKPNAWGLYDMHGNVLEWCQDWYDSSFYDDCPESDPIAQKQGTYRVLRGGCWFIGPWVCRSANRCWIAPGLRSDDIGFRVALDL